MIGLELRLAFERDDTGDGARERLRLLDNSHAFALHLPTPGRRVLHGYGSDFVNRMGLLCPRTLQCGAIIAPQRLVLDVFNGGTHVLTSITGRIDGEEREWRPDDARSVEATPHVEDPLKQPTPRIARRAFLAMFDGGTPECLIADRLWFGDVESIDALGLTREQTTAAVRRIVEQLDRRSATDRSVCMAAGHLYFMGRLEEFGTAPPKLHPQQQPEYVWLRSSFPAGTVERRIIDSLDTRVDKVLHDDIGTVPFEEVVSALQRIVDHVESKKANNAHAELAEQRLARDWQLVTPYGVARPGAKHIDHDTVRSIQEIDVRLLTPSAYAHRKKRVAQLVGRGMLPSRPVKVYEYHGAIVVVDGDEGDDICRAAIELEQFRVRAAFMHGHDFDGNFDFAALVKRQVAHKVSYTNLPGYSTEVEAAELFEADRKREAEYETTGIARPTH